MKYLFLIAVLLLASCAEESVTDRMQRQNKIDSLEFAEKERAARNM